MNRSRNKVGVSPSQPPIELGGGRRHHGGPAWRASRSHQQLGTGSPTARAPQPISGASAAIVDGRLIVVGGEGVTTVSATVQAYDLTASTATWTTLPSLTPGRHGLGVTAIGNTLYAVGGATNAGHTASTNLVGALNFSLTAPPSTLETVMDNERALELETLPDTDSEELAAWSNGSARSWSTSTSTASSPSRRARRRRARREWSCSRPAAWWSSSSCSRRC